MTTTVGRQNEAAKRFHEQADKHLGPDASQVAKDAFVFQAATSAWSRPDTSLAAMGYNHTVAQTHARQLPHPPTDEERDQIRKGFDAANNRSRRG